ncbi:MAG: seryl-tRNA synthetase [Parcubacteria group bacterium Gr01-1014_48]|nr:MAG: seryl-tRNA synthetase [Parcubacteria group bacterium Greene0416_14]TSC74538.1 MAG: seryl-tRNA synthetase [Parcubacteria group bacterium Gr01-1014_48]TSD01414.1 MAG: seryl-tRNA synthetase [Parcubacteria group bacterium Greene1014_15]TSD08444.1 MAG: seryl-tRNA synthetase [Parcubacteria group bacterium Greene0714_4]
MLDIKFIRENKDLIVLAVKKKHIDFDVEELLAVDVTRREILQEVEAKRSEQNEYTERISRSKNPTERDNMIEQMRGLKEELQRIESRLKEVMEQWQRLMLRVPNIPDISVPDGADDKGNQEVRAWGEKPDFNFIAKNHVELMRDLDMADFERGAKTAGFRGYFLKNDGALLSFAVWNFVRDVLVEGPGFHPVFAPSLLKREAFLGTGYLPQGEEDLYKTQDGDYLAGTAEVAMMAYYMDDVLDYGMLPVKFLGFSPCFRREAGSYGKDTRGLMRVHEFFKLEQIILCEASHEKSVEHHEELTANSERIMQRLNIPYHVVLNCGGDLGLGQVKKYDIEAWIPSEKTYRETHSSSYFHDFQSRRLNIRYRDRDGKLRFVHSLNNTAIATPRILIAIVENNQRKDGSIVIPEALEKYMGKKIIGPAS